MRDGNSLIAWLRLRNDYLMYLLGLRRARHFFSHAADPKRISILIPDSVGDIAVNSSVSQYLKRSFPETHITLISHPKYIPAARMDPNYDAIAAFPQKYLDREPWLLSYKDQLAVAHLVTPKMDRLYLPQPSVWCDHVVGKHSMLALQNILCAVPVGQRIAPRLRIPHENRLAAETFCSKLRHPLLAIFRTAYTAAFDERVDMYWRQLAKACLSEGITVLDNAATPLIENDRCIPIGSLCLETAAAVANASDGIVGLRSGICDVVAFSGHCPQYVIYPKTCYRNSDMSFLRWCSLRDMGALHVTEAENSFAGDGDVSTEVARTLGWVRQLTQKRDRP
jgi:hypothetical protein